MDSLNFSPSGLTPRTVKRVLDRGLRMDLPEAQRLPIDANSESFESEAVREWVWVLLDRRPSKPQAGTRS